jgi:hypothetical protein
MGYKLSGEYLAENEGEQEYTAGQNTAEQCQQCILAAMELAMAPRKSQHATQN